MTDLLQELDGAGGRRDANLGLLAGAQAKLQVRPGVSGVDPQILALIHSAPVRVLPKPQPARMSQFDQSPAGVNWWGRPKNFQAKEHRYTQPFRPGPGNLCA